MHVFGVTVADGPSSSRPPGQYKSEFIHCLFTGYDRIEVSNGGNYTGNERLTCTAMTSYLLMVQCLRSPLYPCVHSCTTTSAGNDTHTAFEKFLNVQDRQVRCHRIPTVLWEGTKPRNWNISLTRPHITRNLHANRDQQVNRFGGPVAQRIKVRYTYTMLWGTITYRFTLVDPDMFTLEGSNCCRDVKGFASAR